MVFWYYAKLQYSVKALLGPRGAYLISDLLEGGLIERGLIRGRLIHKIK